MLAASSQQSPRKTPFLPAFCRCVLADRMAHSWFSGTWNLSSSLSAPEQWVYILLPPKHRWWQQIPRRVPKGWVSISTVTAKQVRSFIKQQGCRAGEVGQSTGLLHKNEDPNLIHRTQAGRLDTAEYSWNPTAGEGELEGGRSLQTSWSSVDSALLKGQKHKFDDDRRNYHQQPASTCIYTHMPTYTHMCVHAFINYWVLLWVSLLPLVFKIYWNTN